MSKTKPLLAVGMILLFIGLAFSPATATTSRLVELNKEELPTISFLNDLSLAMSEASNLEQLLEIVNDFRADNGRHPFLALLLQFIVGIISLGNKVNGIRPFRKDAFIMSWGFTNKINPFKDNKFELYRPLTLWRYSGKSNLLLNSRTLIISFSPFSVKMLTGRQIGFMRNFAGIYWHRETTIGEKSHTFFMGKTAGVRGFDLSILNILGQ